MTIETALKSNKLSRIYFKQYDRTPIVGKFVALKDHEELKVKGLVRFVTLANCENFNNTSHVMYSRIFSINSLSLIKLYEHGSQTGSSKL